MPKAAFTLTWSAAAQIYEWSAAGEALSPVPDSPAWLAEVPSFAFHGQSGSFTARQERRARGERYWYAYRRLGQQVRKKYLGRTADLTLARLEQVARLLEAERDPGGLSAPNAAHPPGTSRAASLPACRSVQRAAVHQAPCAPTACPAGSALPPHGAPTAGA